METQHNHIECVLTFDDKSTSKTYHKSLVDAESVVLVHEGKGIKSGVICEVDTELRKLKELATFNGHEWTREDD